MSSIFTTRLGRRAWLRASTGGLLGLPILARTGLAAAAVPARAKRCIVLWMDGGPSHIDTFDPKPEAGSSIRGEFAAIDTAVPGVQFSESFPRLAAQMSRLAVLRGMCTDEADHGRARIYMHTGFKPGQGGLNYPALGAIVSGELGRHDSPLPNFVATGVPLGKYDFVTDSGYRGPGHAALVHADPDATLEHVEPTVAHSEFAARRRTLQELNETFSERYRATAAAGHRAVLDRTLRLIDSGAAQAFDLSQEAAKQSERYGSHAFGRGCLLARRLIEQGVPFVEVYQGNWDTHEKFVVDDVKELMPIVDHSAAVLLDDLAERGLLDETLVVWMGEFGRTPHHNRNGGRDHHSKAWCTLLAGGGVRGGQVIGRTDEKGASVVERPISAKDYLATLCLLLGMDTAREIQTPVGRPIRIVDNGATPITELTS